MSTAANAASTTDTTSIGQGSLQPGARKPVGAHIGENFGIYRYWSGNG